MGSAAAPTQAIPVDRNSRHLRHALTGLQLRFTLLVVGLALAVGTIVGVVTFNFCAMLVNRLHQEHCTQTAALLANKAAHNYGEGREALRRLAEQMVETDPLLFVIFMEPDGQPIAVARNRHNHDAARFAFGITPETTIGRPKLTIDPPDATPFLDVTYPVSEAPGAGGADGHEPANALVGYVRIGFSLERTFAEVKATTDLLTGIAVLVATLTIPLGFLVVRRMVAPLRDLAKTMARFADGELTARSHIRRNDELGDLAGAYNVMAEKLANQHREGLRHKAELEQRVQERTEQLRDLASRDPLTGLYNRRHFNEVMRQSFAAADRYHTDLACMMIDLDDFKAVNDTLGHQVGDEVLCLTSATINEELRTSDVAARYGGDEFIILLPQTSAAQADVFGQRLLTKLREAIRQQIPDCRTGVSAGVAGMTDVSASDADELIRAADDALYKAKAAGKNQIVARQIAM